MIRTIRFHPYDCIGIIPQAVGYNRYKIKKCGDIIESKSTNDYKKCSCGAVSVDGGIDYLKRIGNEEDYEELSAFCTSNHKNSD